MTEGPGDASAQAESVQGLDHEKHEKHEAIVYSEEVYRIQGAIFEVSREMGIGYLEAVYQECLELEFEARGIPFQALRALALNYKGQVLKQTYVPDFICFDTIIVELKVVREIAPEHRAQILNYLKATGLRLGLIVNFGFGHKARVERIVR
jgi:GxxExxY protein